MHINMEPGGVIHQARQHLARYGKPLDEERGEAIYHSYLSLLSRGDVEKYRQLASKEPAPSIGRIAIMKSLMPRSRYADTKLALVSELVGALPDYYREEPGIKEIGRVSIYAYGIHEHNDQLFVSSSVSYDADILTSGDVNLTLLELNICEHCETVDISEDIRMLDRLGVVLLYNSSDEFADLRQGKADYGALYDRLLTAEQLAKLQQYLHDTMSLGPPPSIDIT